MITKQPVGRKRMMLRLATVAVTAAFLPITIGGAAAHGPDPMLSGGLFAQNQDLRFRWRAGSVPPSVIRSAIANAAVQANATRASKAATFTLDAGGANPIGYGAGAPCGVNGLACFTRSAPTGFTMWLREQAHVFDWGTLKWCQAYASPPNGCYDAETIALDEFGHVEGLNHHGNYANDSDYLDAVVQTYSRTKPASGWNMHAFGRCDVASLQLRYDMQSWSSRYSTCLDLATDLALSASSTAITLGGSTTFTATLKVVDYDSYLQLGGNPITGRTVTLQQRAAGASTWVRVGTMAVGAAGGTYLTTLSPRSDADYRAVFGTPSNEGINGDTSPTVSVLVFSQCGSVSGSAPGIDTPCI
jgi:hypothetical protein